MPMRKGDEPDIANLLALTEGGKETQGAFRSIGLEMTMTPHLTLGPVLLNWSADTWRDFYFRVADEMPVDTVFLGEVICSKRAVLFDPYLEDVATRLEAAGKRLAFSTLAEVTSAADRKLVKRVAASSDLFIEANDVRRAVLS